MGGEDAADLKYNISMSETLTNDYLDGFSDGYSRAWVECWNYWLDRVEKSKKEYEELLKKEAEAKK